MKPAAPLGVRQLDDHRAIAQTAAAMPKSSSTTSHEQQHELQRRHESRHLVEDRRQPRAAAVRARNRRRSRSPAPAAQRNDRASRRCCRPPGRRTRSCTTSRLDAERLDRVLLPERQRLWFALASDDLAARALDSVQCAAMPCSCCETSERRAGCDSISGTPFTAHALRQMRLGSPAGQRAGRHGSTARGGRRVSLAGPRPCAHSARQARRVAGCSDDPRGL